MNLSFVISPSDPQNPIGFEAWADDQQFFSTEQLTQKQTVNYTLAEDNNAHTLKFIVKNKTAEHTKLNEQQHIVQDSCIQFEQIKFDELELSADLIDLFVYTHDFNGNGQLGQHKFYNTLGCNGTVTLDFTLPIYVWFLEHM
jgi:hypothetical protein